LRNKGLDYVSAKYPHLQGFQTESIKSSRSKYSEHKSLIQRMDRCLFSDAQLKCNFNKSGHFCIVFRQFSSSKLVKKPVILTQNFC